MPNATPEDTRAGFEIYRSMQKPLDRTQLNIQLRAAGYGPVSERTFGHYSKLVRAGFNRYIAINRFDVARASRAYENASAMARYRYLHTDVGVRVVFVKSNQLFEATGRATQVSDPGAVVSFTSLEIVHGLRALGPRVGDMLSMSYLDTGRAVNGRVADVFFTAERCTVEVEFAELNSITDLGSFASTPTQSVRFVLHAHTDASHTVDLVGRQIYFFLELLEGARALVNRASADSGGGYTAPPILRQLRAESPVSMVVDLWPWVATVVGTVGGVLLGARHAVETRLRWHEGTGKKLDNQDRIALRGARQQARAAESASCDETVELLRQAFPGSEISRDTVEQLMLRDVFPHVHDLGRFGVIEIRIEPADASAPETTTGGLHGQP